MSLQYDSLHHGIVEALESQQRLNESIGRFMDVVDRQFAYEEQLIAEIRDELHEALTALSNRIEAATRTPFACDPDESGGIRDDAA